MMKKAHLFIIEPRPGFEKQSNATSLAGIGISKESWEYGMIYTQNLYTIARRTDKSLGVSS